MNTPGSLRLLILPALLVGACLLLWREYTVAPDGRLHVSFLDVGQGDAAFLQTPSGRQILIDCGPDTALLQGLGKRMSFFDRSIDLLILSHADLDHIGGCIDVLRRYFVGSVLFPEVDADVPRFREFIAMLTEQSIPILLADPARDLDLGDGVTLDVLWPTPEALAEMDDRNDLSVVVKITHGSDSILFTGDIGEEAENALLVSGADVSARILKAGHHGSKTSSSTGFLLAVSPDLAIISAGKDNSFGHPHPSIIQRLQDMGAKTRSTAEEGTIEVVGGG
jgi:competence protein ComEC